MQDERCRMQDARCRMQDEEDVEWKIENRKYIRNS
jgi:hypothetical protein